MNNLNVGDIVARKSYGGDIYFRITNIVNTKPGAPVYTLKGLLYRLQADSHGRDLVKQDPADVLNKVRDHILMAKRHSLRGSRGRYPFPLPIMPMFYKARSRPGKILHIDADGEFMDTCLRHYSKANITAVGKQLNENEQPHFIRQLLEQTKPDVLVVTGHDSIKKNSGSLYTLDNYSTSKYFVQSVKEARIYEPSYDRLCVFAGACQSYYEAIMDAGANFASSPGRVFINALDPALVSEKIALTDQRITVTPDEISQITITGSKGIGGINTKGHLIK